MADFQNSSACVRQPVGAVLAAAQRPRLSGRFAGLGVRLGLGIGLVAALAAPQASAQLTDGANQPVASAVANADASADAKAIAKADANAVAALEAAENAKLPNKQMAADLARNMLIKLVYGHKSGNYKAIYGLLSQEVQRWVPEERMAQALLKFSPPYQDMSLSASGIMNAEPQFTLRPYLDASNMLRLVGVLPTQPFPIRFNLGLVPYDSSWRLESFIVEPMKPQLPPAEPTLVTEPVRVGETEAAPEVKKDAKTAGD